MQVAIVQYGMGNVASVAKALTAAGAEPLITDSADALARADAIVLPGVGSFQRGMEELHARNLTAALHRLVRDGGKPFLGICLGLQLTMSHGHEPVPCDGLGWIRGHVLRMDDTQLQVPHVGWNTLQATGPLLQDFNDEDFYFVHSYHAVPEDACLITGTTDYGARRVVALRQRNIWAFQFHPEKSQQAGISLLRHFLAQVHA